jgi:uncharacterized protein YjbI with pentapeptide repeats/beta-lactamase regulating signal transducer with metallopeptidase domain
MMHPEFFEPFARTIVGALGVGILESALLAFVILGMTKLRPRPTATTRHVFWWIALAASVTLPLVSIAASFGHVERHRVVELPAMPAFAILPATAVANDEGPQQMGNVPSARTKNVPTRYVASPDSAPATPASALADLRRAIAGYDFEFAGLALVAIWLAVAAFGLASLGRSFLTLRSLKRDASPLDENILRRLRRWRHASRSGRAVALAVSNEIDVPLAVGFREPTILLPIQVVEREEIADLDQIAMHEYAHLERYDDWTNLVQRAFERVFWFNPIVAFIGRRISLEREIACDDWVVAQTGHAHRYATCLWRLVESSRLPAKQLLAPGALQSPKQITVRIEQLLDARRNAVPRLSPLGALGVTALCVALIVVQAQRAPVIALTEKVDPAPVTPPIAGRAAARVQSVRAQRLMTIVRVAVKTARPKPTLATSTKTVLVLRTKSAPPAGASFLRDETVIAVAVPALTSQLPPRMPLPVAPVVATSTPVPAPAPPAIERHEVEIRVMDRSQIEALRQQILKSIEELRNGNDEQSQKLRADLVKQLEDLMRQLPELRDLRERMRVMVHPNLVGPNWEVAAPRDPESLKSCVGCAFPNANLRAIDLSRRSIVGANLRGADLTGALLAGVKLVGVDLEGAKLDGSDLRNAQFIGCNLRNASLKNARLDGITIVGGNLRGIKLTGPSLRPLLENCKNCDFRDLDLRGQDLRNLHLVSASMSGVDLRNANLSGSTFEAVDFSQSRLDGADLSNVKLLGCSLRNANLHGANLTGLVIENSSTPFFAKRLLQYNLEFVKPLPKPTTPGSTDGDAMTLVPPPPVQTN